MISCISTLESALVSHLGDGRLPFAASVTGASDPRHADEDQYGILGKYVQLPAVVVECSGDDASGGGAPIINSTARITVRHSLERWTVASHKADSETVAAQLWDYAAMAEAIGASLTVSSIRFGGEEFTRDGRALETVFTLNLIIGGKEDELTE